MRHIVNIIFIAICFSNCGHSLKTIEIKNASGIVIAQYKIDSDSLKQGEAKIYDDEGKLFDLSNYLDDQLTGKRVIYYKNGSIDTEENYKNGILEGPYTQYHKNGNVMQTGSYIEGILAGEVTTHFENGSKKETVTFENNIENGPFTEYYENGKKQWEGTYLNGDNEFGLLTEYDSSENVIKKMNCDSLGMCRTIWTKEEGDITPSF